MSRRPAVTGLTLALAAVLATGCSGSGSDPGDDITDGVPVPGFVLEPAGASISVDGARIAVPCHDRVCVWGAGGSLEAEVDGGAATAWSKLEATDGAVLLTGGDEISFVPVPTGETEPILDLPGEALSIALAAEGTATAIATDDQLVLVGETKTEVEVAATDLALSPDGTRLAVALADGSPQVLSVPDGRVLGTLGDGPVSQVAWSFDGELVAVGGEGGTQVHRADDLDVIAELPEPAAADLAFQPSGSTLAVADADDAALVLWDPASTETTVLEGHSSPSERVLWGSAESLYSVASDAVLAWNLETGDLASTFDLPPVS